MIHRSKWLAGCCRLAMVVAMLALLAAPEAQAETVALEEARQVSQNWLTYMVFERGNWNGTAAPQLRESQEIIRDGALLGYYSDISPSGWIVVPILKELPPIKAYSETDRLDVASDQGMIGLLKDVLEHRTNLYIKRYGSLDAVQPATGDVLFDRIHGEQWSRFLKNEAAFQADLDQGRFRAMRDVDPLLTSSWHQNNPFNNYCPMGYGDRCVVGCVATAAAQIMRFWNWPPHGNGSHSYDWDGDQSCEGHDVGGGELSADFSDAYDWANMLDDYNHGYTGDESAAVAELSYELAVAFNMDFGACGSGANTYDALWVYPIYFSYNPVTIDRENRDDHDAAAWLSIIKADLDAGQPIQYRIKGHSIVCDGWRSTGGGDEIHMNYGWDSGHNTWYTVDNLHCDWEGCDPMVEYLIRGIVPLNQPPVAVCQNVTVSADHNCEAEASIDNGSYDPEGYPLTLEQSPPGPYQLGVTTVTLTVTDPQGASASCVADVTVIDDTPPVAQCPADITQANDVDQCSAVVTFSFSATDNCPGVTAAAVPSSGSTFPVGTTPVTVTATDGSGNTDDCVFTVTVVDTQNPVVTCPEDFEVEFQNPSHAVVEFEATATDNCDADPDITCVPPSGSVFSVGDNLVTCEAYDDAGNGDTCWASFHLVYLDIKPRSCPNPLNVKPYTFDDKSSRDQALDDPIDTDDAAVDRGQPMAVFPVAILGTEVLDVKDLLPETITLNGVSPLRWNFEDAAAPAATETEFCACTKDGPDGFVDLTLKFSQEEIVQSLGSVDNGEVIQLIITGDHTDGNHFYGGDCVWIRGHRGDDDDGGTTITGSPISDLDNYPNPFNPNTQISFVLGVRAHVTLDIFNVLGRRVATLHQGPLEAGEYIIEWDGTDQSGIQVSSGIYLYRLMAGDAIATKKMLLLK